MWWEVDNFKGEFIPVCESEWRETKEYLLTVTSREVRLVPTAAWHLPSEPRSAQVRENEVYRVLHRDQERTWQLGSSNALMCQKKKYIFRQEKKK